MRLSFVCPCVICVKQCLLYFVTQLDSKLNLVPAKLERVISEHDKFKSKYEMMLQLKPVREAVSWCVVLLIVVRGRP